MSDAILSYVKLQLNIKYPSIEECYFDGYDACQQNYSADDNPYTAASVNSYHWLEGWSDSFYGKEPAFGFDAEHNHLQDQDESPTLRI